MAHAAAFQSAAEAHGVSPGLLAAVIFVESGCGRNTGKSLILPRLARLAMANEPENVERNVAWRDDPETARRVRARAQYLWDTFYPEVRAVFDVADRMDVDPLDIRGSESGAFGFPQFLPASYIKHGEDGDGDGRVSLYDMADAAASCARFLAAAGWKPGLSVREQRMVIWQYNRSEPYVETILALADRVERPTGPAQIVRAKAHKKAAKSVKAAASRSRGTSARHARSSHAKGSAACRAGKSPSQGCSSAARSPAALPAS
jgi:membrane-bound lytic murein transglycosylase B